MRLFVLPCQLPPAYCGYPSAPSSSSFCFPSSLCLHLSLLSHPHPFAPSLPLSFSLSLLHSVAFWDSPAENITVFLLEKWIYVYIHCHQLKCIVCILDELQTCVGVLLVMVSCTSMCFIYVCLCCDTFSLASSSISPSLSSLMDATISECLLTVFSMYRCPSSAPKTHTDTHMVTYHGGLGFVMIWYDLVTNNLSEGFMYILIGMITCI